MADVPHFSRATGDSLMTPGAPLWRPYRKRPFSDMIAGRAAAAGFPACPPVPKPGPENSVPQRCPRLTFGTLRPWVICSATSVTRGLAPINGTDSRR